MAPHFVYSATGNNANSGHTTDLAWATLEYASESGSLAAGDDVYVHPLHSETPTSDILMAYSGTAKSWIKVMGMPRTTKAITSSDWTNGSTAVKNDDNDMTESAHEGRYITGPDGETYFITRVIDSDDFVIDREYAGATVTNQAATIQADPDYATFAAIDDSAWTIKIADWIAAGQTRGLIDFNDGNYQFFCNDQSYVAFKNLIFMDSAAAAGLVYLESSYALYLEGILIKQSASNTRIVQAGYGSMSFKRLIVKGSAAGGNQRGIYWNGGGALYLKDSAIYNCGDNGIYASGPIYFENLNVGVEQANGDTDMYMLYSPKIIGRDLKLGGTNGLVGYLYYPGVGLKLSVENYGKVLGAHRTFFCGGYYEKIAVTSTSANKKLSDNVLQITPNIDRAIMWDVATEILVGTIEVDDASKDYGFWIYNDTGATLNNTAAKDDIFLKVEYISSYDDTTEYVVKTTYSTLIDIVDAADADAWVLLGVTGIDPDVADKVRLTIQFCSYSAAGKVVIDTQVVIT